MSRMAVALTTLLAGITYVVLWAGMVGTWGWLETADDWALRVWFDVNADRPGWIGFWRAVSDLLGPTALRIIALAGIAIALIRRRVRVAVFLTVTVMLMGLVTVAAKGLAGRPRPATALAFEASTSFPSGHALGIIVAVLAFTTVSWPRLEPGMRLPATALGAVLVVLVGLSRVALNVHHPSDVIAGWALGLLYFLLCLRLVPPSGRGSVIPSRPAGIGLSVGPGDPPGGDRPSRRVPGDRRR